MSPRFSLPTAGTSSEVRTPGSSWAMTNSPNRLWKEKRGEVEPEDLFRQPYRPAWPRDRGPQPALVRAHIVGRRSGTSSAG